MASRLPLRIYYDLLSQPSRAVLIFLRRTGIPHVEKPVALRKGEQRSPEFTKLNPMQKVPVIEDNGFVLTESVAILKYLATKYNVPQYWYPEDTMQRAKVDEYMAWQHANVRYHAAKVFITEPLGADRDILKDRPTLNAWRTRVQSALGKTFDDVHSFLYQLRNKARL
ncbi:hypothetical protein scyTo_0018307 [Scyliorhinus torazame]|uniref:GST N-terminal domain-containing protein n=1 Tax=Scyliorhinus torazame TaxID=75743 RepID=A0A401PSR8_SCYTO|nr:hypothetical protein [Scyliorhinus torazame]